jgi:hypothetical protein
VPGDVANAAVLESSLFTEKLARFATRRGGSP